MSDTDPTPETPVTIGDRLGWFRGDLVAKFDALSLQLATQHTELLAAITELRGTGPENTLKSVNQAIWNLAGPAPGTSLTDLHSAVTALMGSGEPTTLEDIARHVLTGGGPGSTVYDILLAIGELSHGPANWTVRQLLEAIHIAIDGPLIGGVVIPPMPLGCTVPTDGTATMLMDSTLLSFTVLDTFTANGTEYTNYIPVFSVLSGITSLIHYIDGPYSGRDMAYGVVYPWWVTNELAQTVYCCFAWDTTNTQPLYYSNFGATQLGNGTVTAEGGGALDLPSGHVYMRIYRPNLESTSFAGIVFAAPTGSLPPIYLKMWSSTNAPA